jgi:hypothetical protein
MLKPKEAFLEPDVAPNCAPGPNLDELYAAAAALALHDGVPDDVSGYFDVAVMLWFYGYLYRPFIGIAVLEAYMAVEMALNARFPGTGRMTIGPLLRHAIKEGVVRDENYRNMAARQRKEQQLGMQVALRAPARRQPYSRALAEAIPKLRNNRAHPTFQMILPAGMAWVELVVAQETINQLWPLPE